MDKKEIDKLTERIIGIAMEIHRQLGPGFIEKIYEKALIYEFDKRKIDFRNQAIIKVSYKNTNLGNQRVDFIIEETVIVEIKSSSGIIKIFENQLISYLKTSGIKVGLILNFGSNSLGIKRLVCGF